MKQSILAVAIILIVALITYAGGPSYIGQVRVFLKQEHRYSDAQIDSITSLPQLPAGKYLYVKEDFLAAAVVTIHKDGSGTAEPLYDKTGKKR